MAPVKALQPRSKSIRYDNVKSAVAEEGILAQLLLDPSLLDCAQGLKAEDFSVEIFGKAYAQLADRYQQGLEVSLAVLADMSAEEMDHLTGAVERQQGVASETAFRDCVGRVLAQRQSKSVTSDADLLNFRNKLKERKGTD